MLPFIRSFSFFLCNFFVSVFGVIIRHFSRIQADYGTRIMNFGSVHTIERDRTTMEISFEKFDFAKQRVDCRRKREPETSMFQSVSPENVSVSASNSSKYQSKPSLEIHGFIEESETVNCLVEELYVSTDGSPSSDNQSPDIGFSSGKYLWEFCSEREEAEKSYDEGEIEEFVEKFSTEEDLEEGEVSENNDQILMESRIFKILENQNDAKPNEDDEILKEGGILGSEDKILDGFESFPEVQILGEDYSFSSFDSDSESDIRHSESNDRVISSEISDDSDGGGGMELETLVAIRDESNEEICLSDDTDSERVDNFKNKFYISEDEEFIELELHQPVFTVSYAKVLPINDSTDDGYEMENSIRGEKEHEDSSGKSEDKEWLDKQLKYEEDDDEEDEDEREFLQEHQDLIEQLKMELRNARTGGLPTILEEEEEVAEPESVSPDLVQRLRPWKNDGSFEYKQQLKEIQKVYKIYAEKMRKLDVLNSQTMHAIGFLKLKDPVSPIARPKSPIRAVKSLLSHNLLWSHKAQKPSADAAPRFIMDLNRDLEVVYVGHLCLSWELMHWQHRKAISLQENDPQRTHQYNQVVNKFQLFCVLVQRFVEDEQFHGPRIENYVKNRYIIRSLLQVPDIREDCSNDKRVRLRDGENTVSIQTLVQIIEDSMRVFWEFLRTDKDLGNLNVKGAQQLHQTDLQRPADIQLMMMEIRAILQKKEKRLKDILRSGNCIVKKLQRNNEECRVLNNALFIAQVELKLVSRVVNMSKLTESQLIWCHKKLNQINFLNRKVVIEPSFLLFPC